MDKQKTLEIKTLLTEYNITQAQIAKRAQISRAGVCNAINGFSKSRRIMKIIWDMLKERSVDDSKIAFLLTTDEDITMDQPLKKLLKKAGIKQSHIAQKAQVRKMADI